MTRAERYAQVKALRDDGLLLREISERVGLAIQTISDLLSDPTGDLARKRKARYRTPCIDCGTLTNPNGKVRHERCNPCAAKRKRELSRKWIIDSIHEWADMTGGIPPVVADWSPAHARQQGTLWRIERMKSTGRPWPSQQLVHDNFGSWNAGIWAAGFEPFPPGHYGREGEMAA